MNNSTLIQYFRRLNPKDLREMDKFVQSPYFNTKREISQLFYYIKQEIPSTQGNLQREKAYKFLFPNKAYNEKQMSYCMSGLLKLIKKYFALSVAQQDPIQQPLNLCRALRERRMERQFQQELAQTYKTLEKQPARNTQYHYHYYQLKREELHYTNNILDHRRAGAELLEKMSNSLTAFYTAELLQNGCGILTLQSLKSREYNLNFLEDLLPYLAENEIVKVPVVNLYFHSYQAIKSLDSEDHQTSEIHFNSLKKGIQEHWSFFAEKEIRDIYTLAVNYCIRRLNQGDKRYIREAFDLYRAGFDQNVWLENKVLSGYTYKNVARLGIALEEEDWVRSFIEQYKKNLPKKEQENYWRYNLAYLHFQQNDYPTAMELLREIEFKDVLNNLDTRRMLLRCYYELEEIYALEYLLDSFQKYIQRQKGIGYHKSNYLNLIRFIRKKLQIPRGNKQELLALAQEIQNTEQVAEKSWLLKQLS